MREGLFNVILRDNEFKNKSNGKGYLMEERRKSKRTQLPVSLIINKLGDGESREVEIEVFDASKSGVGFTGKEALQIGEVYEAYLTIWTKEVLHAFLRIVRIELKEQEYIYGAAFVGMPELDVSRIEAYQVINENEK